MSTNEPTTTARHHTTTEDSTMEIFAMVVFTVITYFFTKRDFKEAKVRATRRAYAHRNNPNWRG